MVHCHCAVDDFVVNLNFSRVVRTASRFSPYTYGLGHEVKKRNAAWSHHVMSFYFKSLAVLGTSATTHNNIPLYPCPLEGRLGAADPRHLSFSLSLLQTLTLPS